MKRKLGKSLCSMFLALAMVVGLMPGLSLTANVAPAETLLTTITPTDLTTFSETKEGVFTGVVTVSHNNDEFYKSGWMWDRVAGTLTVSVGEGYTITKVIFIQGTKTPVTDSSAPFELHFDYDPEGTALAACRENNNMYGVTSIEVYGYANTVAVNGLSLEPSTASIPVGGEPLTLTPTVSPDNATDKTVTWTTSDASVATVADGVVTAVAAGTATITATATNGTVDTSDDKTATCTVTVVPAPVDPTKPDTPTPEPVTPASESEVPADTTPSGSSSPAPVITPEQARVMTVSNFVERLYLTALNRSYDVTGRDNWVDQITNKDASGSAIARGFFNSQEFIARELDNEEFVNTLYRVFFDREPDTQGFTNWINALENGATRSEVINEFAGSTEWTSMCARFGINA